MSDKTEVTTEERKAALEKKGFVAHQMLVGGKTEKEAKEAFAKQEQSDANFEIRKEACVRVMDRLTAAKKAAS